MRFTLFNNLELFNLINALELLKYELETLNTLVFTEINPTKFIDKEISNGELENLKSLAELETERIKKTLKNKIFCLKKERQIENYIQYHQQELIRLIDHLLKYFKPDEAAKIYEVSEEQSLINLHKHVYHYLEDLLTYIEKYFSKYFSLRAKIPDCYRLIAIRDFQEHLPDIESQLKESGADSKLLQIVFLPLKRFVLDKYKEDISFRKLIYLKNMLKELRELSKCKKKNTELDQNIICNLTYLNYNSYRFFGFCTEHIKSNYQKEDTLCDQLEKLAWFYKCISQAQIKPGASYKPKQKPIKENLLEWIDEEICFLEKRQQLTLNINSRTVEDLSRDFKMNMTMSVPQLAYFVRLLLDTNVVQNRNQKEVLKFISQFVRTKKAENISPESLRTKFYNIEDSTKEAVKDILINMLNYIRKN